MASYLPFSPVEIRFMQKEAALSRVEELLAGKGPVLVLIQDRMMARLHLDEWVKNLTHNHGGMGFHQIPANPDITDLYRVLNTLGKQQFGCILAIGGGSCMDLAKAVCAFHGLIPPEKLSADRVREIIQNRKYEDGRIRPDIIVLPTTAGTGSEVTRWATVWDQVKGEKLSVEMESLFPKAALVVPEFTALMPEKLTLSTGLDALSHAMEAFWAVRRTPLSQALALQAIGDIRDALPRALQNPCDFDARQAMCTASLTAGLAFSITRTTACHAISYPLTLLHGVPHGFAAALTLNGVMMLNRAAVPEISRIENVFLSAGGFHLWIEKVSKGIQPLTLSAFGIAANDIAGISEKSFTKGRMDNNPVSFSQEDIQTLLQACL